LKNNSYQACLSGVPKPVETPTRFSGGPQAAAEADLFIACFGGIAKAKP